MHFITDLTQIGIILCGVSFFTKCEGKPVKRRAVSEMQLMHNYGEFIHSLERQEWLQLKLQNLYPASVSTPQESTSKVAENSPQKPHKQNKFGENRTNNLLRQNQRAHQTKLHRHSGKPNADSVLKPDSQ
ncbi:hypothetical protein FKM82_003250 [Ascaphus truei]